MSDEVRISDSGGTMTRLTEPAEHPGPLDLAVLERHRRVVPEGAVGPAGRAPYFLRGEPIGWHYGASTDAMVVIRDDERGLVAWMPSGSRRRVAVPRGGGSLRERTLEERARIALTGDYDHAVGSWRGTGVLRIAPSGAPWSVWFFTEDDGSFAGHYVNLELPHVRPSDGARRVHTRDLTLDLWLEHDGTLWLKDADELDAWRAAGLYTDAEADTIAALSDLVRREVVEPRAWPLDEGWESWRPPAEHDRPAGLDT